MSLPTFEVAPTGRNIDDIMRMHELIPETFQGAVVYDVGCAYSDLQRDLALKGIRATVIGFDSNPQNFLNPRLGTDTPEPISQKRVASADDLPVEDESADVVIATYSLPLWAETAAIITGFFHEADRVLRPGGLFSVHPIVTHCRPPLDPTISWETDQIARETALNHAVRDISLSSRWDRVGYSSATLTARKLSSSS